MQFAKTAFHPIGSWDVVSDRAHEQLERAIAKTQKLTYQAVAIRTDWELA